MTPRITTCETADDRRVMGMHPAIDRALDAFPARLTNRASELIRLLLGERVDAATPDAWMGSRLTGDGFPFELSFCTADDRLRFALEPGSAHGDHAHRLDVANALLRMTTGAAMPPDVLARFRALQTGAPLKYGTWLGGRVDTDHHVLKLYVEATGDGSAAWPFAPSLRLDDRTPALRMVGYVPVTGTFETYLRIPSFEPRHLPAILAPAGLSHRADELVDLLAGAYGHALRGRLPGPSVGVSYNHGETTQVTLHFYARALWGSDARIRRGFLRLAHRHSWAPDTYLHVTSSLAARERWDTFHGLLGITLTPSGHALTLGVRPVLV